MAFLRSKLRVYHLAETSLTSLQRVVLRRRSDLWLIWICFIIYWIYSPMLKKKKIVIHIALGLRVFVWTNNEIVELLSFSQFLFLLTGGYRYLLAFNFFLGVATWLKIGKSSTIFPALTSSGWLEPLLDRIARNVTYVVTPIIDVIDDSTFQYHYGPGVAVGGFDWNLQVAFLAFCLWNTNLLSLFSFGLKIE